MEERQGFSLCADNGGKLHPALLYVQTLGSAEMREKLLRWAEKKFGVATELDEKTKVGVR